MSAICLEVLAYLIWISGSKLILAEQPIHFHSVGSGGVSDGQAPAFDDHIGHRTILSQKQKRDARWLEMCAFGETSTMVSVMLLGACVSMGVAEWDGVKWWERREEVKGRGGREKVWGRVESGRGDERSGERWREE